MMIVWRSRFVLRYPLWAYEEELRISINIPRHKVALPDSAFKEVILGCQMPAKDKAEIGRLVRSKFKDVQLLEARMSLEVCDKSDFI